jgi:hypothetical protein
MIGFYRQPVTKLPKSLSTPQLNLPIISHGPGDLRHRSGEFNSPRKWSEQLAIPVLGEPLIQDGVSKKENELLQTIDVPNHFNRNIILSRFGNEQQVLRRDDFTLGERKRFCIGFPFYRIQKRFYLVIP